MQQIKGNYFNGKSSASHSAILELGDSGVMELLQPEKPKLVITLKQSKIMPPIGNTPIRICFGDGEQFVTNEHVILKNYMASSGVGALDRAVHKLENRWSLVFGSLLIMVVLACWSYLYGIPMATRTITNLIPTTKDRQIGENLLKILDETSLFEPSTIPEPQKQRFQSLFTKTILKLPKREGLQYKLIIRHSARLGANAIAIPSGTIIATDDFIRLIKYHHEFQGVIAHEVGHIYYRHGIRNTIQQSLLSMALVIMVGDTSTILEDITNSIPLLLSQTGYSRKFEREADRFAYEYLKKEKISGNHFANILTRISQSKDQNKLNTSAQKINNYLSTHPGIKERIQLFRDDNN
ncbi:MAG: M48 family metallopeptidase [Magnetococcales bacterium]|nr:M48 family metallopeptidase [Magnetococcales bacterium]